MSDELPFDSRGGFVLKHYFPVDAEYSIRVRTGGADSWQICERAVTLLEDAPGPELVAALAQLAHQQWMRDALGTAIETAERAQGLAEQLGLPLPVKALAVREMGMTTEEAVWAATAGGARALRRTDIGHLGVGARADLILLDAPSHTYLAYRPGVPQIAAVWQAGNLVAGAVP